ncbi:MAG: toll/interleukin-1 receptor domain-containing protein [Chloroflexi bacterium]|nr:toll/interleukin-1 receptor domain-containing protein [Chloroflexota bacterium]
MTDYKYDVFISYSHADEDWVVNTLLPTIEDAGIKACIDFRDFVPGKPSRANMRDAVKESAYTLLVMTPAWMASEWTAFEGLLSFLHDPAGSKQRTVPLLKEECEIPEDIQIFTYIDFTREDREEIAWSQLFTALGKPKAPTPGTSAPPEKEPEIPKSWFLAHPYGMPAHFTGRRAERNMLTGWLNSDKEHPLLILRALGGFGKSALSWYWLTHDVDSKKWPKVVWWSFYAEDASFNDFLKETLLDFGVPNADKMNPRQQTNILLNALQQPGILLILDGFERVLRAYGNMGAAYQGDELDNDRNDSSRDCVNPYADAFLQGIGAFGYMLRSKVLMSTRLTPRAVERYGQLLQGVREEELAAMHKDDAVAFFKVQGIRGTRSEIESACTPYQYHPLSLRILAGYILGNRRKPNDIAVARELNITEDIIQNKHHVLEIAYNSLSPEEAKLLSTIACFRSPTSYEALQSIMGRGDPSSDGDSVDIQGDPSLKNGESDSTKTGRPYDESDDQLKELEERGLLHWDKADNKYDLHPIVRRYAYERLTAPDRTAAHNRLKDYFEAVPEKEKITSLNDLAPVIELYHHMVRAGQFDEARELFRDRLTNPLYFQLGAYQQIIELMRALFIGGEDKPLKLKEESAQAWTLNTLANASALNGEPRRAVPLFEMHNDIYEKAGNKKNLAAGLGNVAYMAQIHIGALGDAERNLRRSIDLCREIEDEEKVGTWQYFLAHTLIYLGNWNESNEMLDAAATIKKKSNHVQAQSVILAYRSLRALLIARETDNAKLKREYCQQATESAQRALELADEWARTRYPMERDYVRAHWMLGASYRAMASTAPRSATELLEKAEKHLSESLQRCRAINNVEHEADILLEVSKLRYTQNESEEALRLAKEALIITERSGYVLQGADVNLFLAELALEGVLTSDGVTSEEQAPKELAREYAQKAKDLAHCDDGPPHHYKVAYDEAEALLEKLKE